MNFFKFLLYSFIIIFLYIRLKSGPYIYQSGKKYYIDIKNHNFNIEELNIRKGDTLIFTNKDQIRHTVTTKNMNIENSEILFQYDTFEVTINKANIILVFESSLYQNMNKLKVNVSDIYNDDNSYNIFKKNLLTLKNKILKF